MKQSKINKAYLAVVRLCDLRLPIKKARQIYRLYNEMREHFEFAAAEERKCVATCAGQYNPDGTVKFENYDNYLQFQLRIEELNNSELAWNLDPVVLIDSDIGDQNISVSDIRDLEGFVIFE